MQSSTTSVPWFLVLAFVVGLVHSADAQQVETGYRPTVGQVHPEFEYPQISDGKPARLSQFRGNKVLLLHFASW